MDGDKCFYCGESAAMHTPYPYGHKPYFLETILKEIVENKKGKSDDAIAAQGGKQI